MKTTVNKFPKIVTRLFWITIFILVWQGYVKLFDVSPMLFPPVEEIVKELWQGFVTGDLLAQTLYSMWIIVLGLAVAAVAAFLLALLSGINGVTNSFVDTLMTIMHPLPGLALLPLVIMWFGTGSLAVLVIIVHSALWPILQNILTGFKSVPQIYLDTAKSFSLGGAATVFEIMLKSSMAYIISGVKIGWARAWRALISAEMVFGAVGNKGGIGWFILKQRTFMNTAGLFAGIIVVIALGVLVEDCIFAFVEKNTVKKWGMIKEQGGEG
ncbi:MAG: ABC transporter permease subunit [Oscillospiraceae bacterium]